VTSNSCEINGARNLRVKPSRRQTTFGRNVAVEANASIRWPRKYYLELNIIF
jgi:hypothetical protein